MYFDEFKFVYVNEQYLEYLNSIDHEVMFLPNSGYGKKPHLGILLTNPVGYKYVLPLTSAKEKHKDWKDVTATNYRVFEIIDIRTAKIDSDDIIVDVTNTALLRAKGISPENYMYFKKRILSILEIKKMFPVLDEVISYAVLNPTSVSDEDEIQRAYLMRKEYNFLLNKYAEIKDKAEKIYNKQKESGNILPFHCNFSLLENSCDEWKLNQK